MHASSGLLTLFFGEEVSDLRTQRATRAFYSRSGDTVLLPFKHSVVTAVKDRSPSVTKAKLLQIRTTVKQFSL